MNGLKILTVIISAAISCVNLNGWQNNELDFTVDAASNTAQTELSNEDISPSYSSQAAVGVALGGGFGGNCVLGRGLNYGLCSGNCLFGDSLSCGCFCGNCVFNDGNFDGNGFGASDNGFGANGDDFGANGNGFGANGNGLGANGNGFGGGRYSSANVGKKHGCRYQYECCL